ELAMLGRLQAVLAKADEVGAPAQAVIAALVLLAVLGTFWLQHDGLPRLTVTGRTRRTFAALGARVVLLFLANLGEVEHLALINPHLDADDAVGRLGLGKTVIDVGTQRVQRHTTLAVPLRTRDLGAV